MKVTKLTATARADVESARKRALPLKIDDFPHDDLLDADEYEQMIRGSPEAVRVADRLLSDTAFWEKSAAEPIIIECYDDYAKAFNKAFEDALVFYQDCLYDVRGHFTDDQRRLLVLETADKERQLFERLKAKFDSAESRSIKLKRERIPEAVRIGVWRRDEGRCARCRSREKLEYDHIIPIDRGGSNTMRNVELLCERCNRAKSNNIE